MNKELVIEKGYTLTVTSWENDGDNYRTESMTVETLEEARRIYRVCNELFKSDEGGVGNSMDGESEEAIEEYIENNPELNLTEEEIRDLSYDLMGSSEYYDYRVCESVSVTYSPEDIYLEKIEF
jgi:hypothetical protein